MGRYYIFESYRMFRCFVKGLTAYTLSYCVIAIAMAKGLPTPVGDGWGLVSGSGDWMSFVEIYSNKGLKVLILVASSAGFIWASYAALTKFNDCRSGKSEWSELGLISVVIASLMVLNTLLLTSSEQVIASNDEVKEVGYVRSGLLPREWWGERTNYAYNKEGDVMYYPNGIDTKYVDENGVYHPPKK